MQTFCNWRASKVSKNSICIKLYPHASNFKLNELFADFIMQLPQQKISLEELIDEKMSTITIIR